MKKTYYKSGPLEVTNEFVKARTRSIQLSTLESVDFTRKLFFAALGLCGGLIAFGLMFGDLLYMHEIIIVLALGASGLFLGWNVATLTIYSKLTGQRGWSITGTARAMRDMRGAIETALEDRTALRRRQKQKAYGTFTADNEAETDDNE
jgi:hypothetical protein